MEEYGKHQFKKGDIAVWRGWNPCIGRIKMAVSGGYAFGKKKYNSLSASNLRPATEDEKALLGDSKRIAYNLPYSDMDDIHGKQIWIVERMKNISNHGYYHKINPSASLDVIADMILSLEKELENMESEAQNG